MDRDKQLFWEYLNYGIFNFLKKDNKHWVKRSDKDIVFTLPQSQYDRIAKVTLAKLILNASDQPDSQSPDTARESITRQPQQMPTPAISSKSIDTLTNYEHLTLKFTLTSPKFLNICKPYQETARQAD